jgi:anaerobic magnesium-protoporphyrin IX monomethyl ester cyclase
VSIKLDSRRGNVRSLFVCPNFHSSGAQIAGSWPPAWGTYLSDHLRQTSFGHIHFINTMRQNVCDEDVLKIASEMAPRAVSF